MYFDDVILRFNAGHTGILVTWYHLTMCPCFYNIINSVISSSSGRCSLTPLCAKRILWTIRIALYIQWWILFSLSEKADFLKKMVGDNLFFQAQSSPHTKEQWEDCETYAQFTGTCCRIRVMEREHEAKTSEPDSTWIKQKGDGWSRGSSPPSPLISFGAGWEASLALIRLT